MVNIFPSSPLFRFALAGLVTAVVLSKVCGDPASNTLKNAEAQIEAQFATMEAAEDPRPRLACQPDRTLFLQERIDPSTGIDSDGPRCDLEMHAMVRATMATARGHLTAKHFDQAQKLAMTVLRYNNSVLGRRSLLAVALSSTSAKSAVELLQVLAARSTSPTQRHAWQESLDGLLAQRLEVSTIKRYIVLGEAKYIVQRYKEESPRGADLDLYRNEIIGTARLLDALESEEPLAIACPEAIHAPPLCRMLVHVTEAEVHIGEQLTQLREMLRPRT